MDKLYLILADSDCDWIIISGVTDHMTFDANDFSKVTQPRRTTIANPNGVTYPVTGAGTVALSSSLALSHTLLVPSLSNKLLSDIPTKDIIGRAPGISTLQEISVETNNRNKMVAGGETIGDVDVSPMSPRVDSMLSESEEKSPHSSIPEVPSHENIYEISSPTTTSSHTKNLELSVGYILPLRHNRGKPPNRYSPDYEERRTKYPIANYVSTQKLSEPLKAFVHTLSSCHVPKAYKKL
ncbi:hypothetical protein GH714_004152 [Hevea brasiliensis]|uniref:Retrovirus-related Pol polyprotein from transposon TNT 1-94-like beta-barrel domain-containing protein n=1 Tax=Hevea brasiliensis TaxID=3981 RepID=A0A6A6NFL5_HEVBR|nr:hypothetical protein GH714_004152 [Hevea brasiliensis]